MRSFSITSFGGGTGPAFWDPLLHRDYLPAAPENWLRGGSSVVAALPKEGAGWVWAKAVPADPWTLNIYALDEDGNWFSNPDTGQPY